MHFPGRRSKIALALLAAASLTAGCGSTSTKPSAHVRGVDAATNGGTVTAVVNGASAYNTLTIDSAPTQYLFVETGSDSTFSYTSFTIPTNGSASVSTFPTNGVAVQTAATLADNGNYTAFIVGRPDLIPVVVTPAGQTAPPPPTPATANAHAMQVVVANDAAPALTSGKSNLRILDAAPDGGNVDVLIDGHAAATNIAFKSLSSFTAIASGPHSIVVNKTGTSTAIVPATSVTFVEGKAVTLIVTEPTSPIKNTDTTPLTYALKTIQD